MVLAAITVEKGVTCCCQSRCEKSCIPVDSQDLENATNRIIPGLSQGKGLMRKKRGVWVFHGDPPLAADAITKTVQKVRRERHRQILGPRISTAPAIFLP